MAALAKWCLRHRWAVLGLWLVALFGTGAAGGALGSDYANNFSLPGTESTRAQESMRDAFPALAGDTDTVVWRVTDGTVRDAETRRRMTAALADIADVDQVGTVAGPYGKGGAARVSEDGRTAYAEVTFTEPVFELDKANVESVVERAERARADGLQVELGGQAVEQTQQPPSGLAEGVGILAAAVVLLLAFGSFFAMLLPLLNAVFAVGTGMAGLLLLSNVMDLPEAAPLLGSLIGLGVGIDYALFIVTRHRRGLKAGLAPDAAAVRAMDTSGRAVLFAGGTVCVALLAMFTLRLDLLNGIALATVLTTVLSVLAATTLLPAMLGFLGPRALSRRERRRLDAGDADGRTSGLALRWAGVLERRPRALALVAVVVLAALAVPALSLRLGANDQGNAPTSLTTRKAYDLLADGFGPGVNGPLLLVGDVAGASGADGEGSGGGGEAERRAFARLTDRVADMKGVARVESLPVPHGGKTAVAQVVPTTSPQSEATDRLIDTLRERTVPAAERGSALRVDVGGATAGQKDFASVISGKLPLFVTVIVALGALLLLMAFRSLVVPLTAALMNLIAAGASFGLLVAVFQWGWGIDLLALGKEGPIISFLPVIMLPLLFGLSMDYQVFLVSRMHEEWTHTRDNGRAVRAGLADTSRVINSAALIMICVFAAFALSGDPAGAMAGVGLAGAVALDAFILRTVLVPALMFLLGRANWWLPGWLDRGLPHLAVDPPDKDVRAGSGPQPSPSPEAPTERDPDDADDRELVRAAPGTHTGAAPRRALPRPRQDGTRVRGTVRDVDGASVAGAQLTLVSAGGLQLARTRSSATGEYELPAPGSGAYIVVVTTAALGATSRSVLISDAPYRLDLQVAPPQE
ncbi:MMPL family transporter [Streptomyces sp. NBC_01186]|uniref:MMPL family transporter n=1 Tax=Streptomyces sp. NBC_01186 TaxID=2903765 RepID=UPI002E107D7B|nr:MMPL family transporter [Streptomyces sp. NBC_01186]